MDNNLNWKYPLYIFDKNYEIEHCFKRIVHCIYCEQPGPFDLIKSNHEEECSMRPVDCPNSCGASLLKGKINDHRLKECPEEIVDCLMNHVGCDEKFPRKYQKVHIGEKLLDHLLVFQENFLIQKKEHENEIQNLKKEIVNLTTELSKVKSSQQSKSDNQQASQLQPPHFPAPPPTTTEATLSFIIPGSGSGDKVKFLAVPESTRYVFSPTPSSHETRVEVHIVSSGKSLQFVMTTNISKITQTFNLPFEIINSDLCLEGTSVIIQFPF